MRSTDEIKADNDMIAKFLEQNTVTECKDKESIFTARSKPCIHCQKDFIPRAEKYANAYRRGYVLSIWMGDIMCESCRKGFIKDITHKERNLEIIKKYRESVPDQDSHLTWEDTREHIVNKG